MVLYLLIVDARCCQLSWKTTEKKKFKVYGTDLIHFKHEVDISVLSLAAKGEKLTSPI